MGVVTSALRVMGLVLLGVGAFEVFHPWNNSATPSFKGPSTPAVNTIQWSPPGNLPANSAPSGRQSSQPPTAIEANSLNWAGIVQQSSGEMSVEAAWKVPNFSQPASNPNSAVAEWIGLGGVASNNLIQIGTITSPNASGQAMTTVFWENLPHPAVQAADIPTGSTVNAAIKPSGADQWRLTLTVAGRKGAVIDQVVRLTPAQATAVESSADWITEAPSTNQGQAPLAPVSKTTMTAVKANGVPLSQINPNTLQSIGLYDSNGQLIAEPSANTSRDSVTVTTVYNPDTSSSLPPGPGWNPHSFNPGGYGHPYGPQGWNSSPATGYPANGAPWGPGW